MQAYSKRRNSIVSIRRPKINEPSLRLQKYVIFLPQGMCTNSEFIKLLEFLSLSFANYETVISVVINYII